MKKYQIINLFIVLFFSCQSFPGKRALNLIYMNPKNCGFVQFYRDVSLRYFLGDKSQEKCADNKTMPAPQIGEIGKYSFKEKTGLTPKLLLTPKDQDSFEIRFEENMKTLFIKRKNALEEELFERMK